MKTILIFALLALTIGIAFEDVYAQTVPEPEPEPEPEPSDVIPPVVTVPEDFIVAAKDITGAYVVFDGVSATDDIDGDIVPVCTPNSGDFFWFGMNTVICTAIDNAGNKGQASFTVTVADLVPPTVNVPENIVLESTITSDLIVTFDTDVSATDDLDVVDPIVDCTPQSGSEFIIGTTEVICTAIDNAGNKGQASFTVTINNLLTVLNEELLALGDLSPNDLENLGTHVSKFVRTSNILFKLEQQGIKDLQSEFNESQKLGDSAKTRTEFNKDLSEFRKDIRILRQDYQDIFEDYRNEVKQLIKEKKGLTVSDKKNLQEFEKIKLRIQNTEAQSLDKVNSFIDESLNQELKINENKLRKLNQLIAFSEFPLNQFSDSQIAKWKQEQIELFSTVQALKIVMSSSDKDQKSDAQSLIKEIKNQIKEEKKKEEKQKENKSKNNSDKGKSGDNSKKSSNKGKKK
ncbi:HYR domain-containing protein [Candidatus Nitrosopumilus sp. SW]|uniref:HYR domain-containing protein n=1 Tax=Candidatus Nitrosopumilus sp. SW TaxID=2508726 RepID=UPI00114D6B5E|nr:HYR domain-containing protein [Candidatus Nitrosopumilus sp. SW]QDI89621.1 HYR domain-containing protein [Candidatus Nitrosopumilus sp. SW]